MITGIAHACYTVANLDQTQSFYCDKLGFSHAFNFKDDDGNRTGVYLKVGGRTFVEFFEGEHEGSPKGQSFRHICLEVDNLKATVEDMRAKDVEVSDPQMGLDHSWQAWVTDPDGNRLELHEYTPKSWQAPHL